MINGIQPEPSTMDFDSAMDRLLDKIQENFDTRSFGGRKMNLSLKKGRKFIKVIHDNSVWGFVSLVDGEHKGAPIKIGDIMKAESWRAAAKHSRGNIFDKEFHKSFSWTGPNYL